jgi:Reverse transcriptase (RNA-dependent DNA polymerase)
MKNIFWYDETSNTVKIASHVRFDEGMSDMEDPPPNVKILRRAQDGYITTSDDCPIDDPVDISIDSSPFRELHTFTISTNCDHPTFGFEVGECHLRRRAFVSGIPTNTSASKVRNLRRKFVGSYIVQIGNTPIYDANDATDAFQAVRNNTVTNKFDIILAPDKYIPKKDQQEHMQLDIGQIRCITKLRTEPASNKDLMTHIPTDLSDFTDSPFPSSDDIRLTIHSLLQTATDITPATMEENACKGKFTRSKLRHIDTWDLWLAAETKQLDAMLAQGMFGEPCDLPPGALVLFAHWNYYMKADGTRQARNCCDGSLRAAPQLRSQAHTYSSCVEQPCQRAFYALCAAFGYYILCTDVCNAYANADAPSIPTYIYVDAAYAEWYYTKFGKRIERGKVLPVLHALQGHPESGRLWEIFINKILLNKFNLRNTTHERNLYSGTFNEKPILVKRQVDDIAVASPCPDTARAFINALSKHVQLKGNDILTTFNGIQVEQSSDYIRVHCTRYIERLVAAHGWDTTIDTPDSHYHNNSQPREPLSASLIQQIDKDIGPPESSPEGQHIARLRGFKYRQLLGELMYAYIICRLDIGYVLIKLAQFSTTPADIHYTCLKRIALYLRNTKHWGLTYWRPTRLPDLPSPTFPTEPIDINLTNVPPFLHTQDPTQLVGYVDAAYATDTNTRRSVTGFVITLCGAAICYRSKLQPTVSTSSTEAEFIAAVTAAKAVKYLRSVLSELGDNFKLKTPTIIYEDNTAAIEMINAGKPTNRTRHVDIQLFAIQEWKNRGDIVLAHIPGIINIADSLTKALGWILHNRHVRRAMGHFYPPWKKFTSWIHTNISPSP